VKTYVHFIVAGKINSSKKQFFATLSVFVLLTGTQQSLLERATMLHYAYIFCITAVLLYHVRHSPVCCHIGVHLNTAVLLYHVRHSPVCCRLGVHLNTTVCMYLWCGDFKIWLPLAYVNLATLCLRSHEQINISLWLCRCYYLTVRTECVYNKCECVPAFHQTEWEISFLTGWTQRRLMCAMTRHNYNC
jgi:hypothetical protein